MPVSWLHGAHNWTHRRWQLPRTSSEMDTSRARKKQRIHGAIHIDNLSSTSTRLVDVVKELSNSPQEMAWGSLALPTVPGPCFNSHTEVDASATDTGQAITIGQPDALVWKEAEIALAHHPGASSPLAALVAEEAACNSSATHLLDSIPHSGINSLWSYWLLDSKEPSWRKAVSGACIYGLADLAAQFLNDGRVTPEGLDYASVAAIAVMGALLDGVLNPLWDANVQRHLFLDNKPHLRHHALHFVLNNAIWTPVCCILLSGVEEVVNTGLNVSSLQTIVPLTVASASVPPEFTLLSGSDLAPDDLIDSATAAGQLDVVRSILGQLLPAEMRPWLKRFVDILSWTLLGGEGGSLDFDDGVVPGDNL